VELELVWAVSIPLAILSSVILLSLLHQTITLLTLGGLALAVGILVYDATCAVSTRRRLTRLQHHVDTMSLPAPKKGEDVLRRFYGVHSY
jgi:multidrug efflux pump subunit AcrB